MSEESLEKFTLRYRVDVLFGIDTIRDGVKMFLDHFKPSRVVVVCGRRSARVSGALSVIENILEERKVHYLIFDRVHANPTIGIANELLRTMMSHRPDAVIAVGGGSVLDTSKIVSCVYASGGEDVRPYFYGEKCIKSKLPLLAVNLTHGTGSEVDRFGVLTDELTRHKRAMASDLMYPSLSVDDPKLTVTLPREQTVYTSIDAFYHCVESSSTTLSSRFTRTLASEAMTLIVENLHRAYRNGEDIEARYWLLYASMLGGICLDNSRAHIVHAVEHAISGLRPDIPHGLGLAVVGPKLISYLYSKVPEKFTVLQTLIPDLRLQPREHRRIEYFLKAFVEQFGIKCNLSELGFGRDDLRDIVRLTFEASPHLLNLCPYKISPEELAALLEELV